MMPGTPAQGLSTLLFVLACSAAIATAAAATAASDYAGILYFVADGTVQMCFPPLTITLTCSRKPSRLLPLSPLWLDRG